MRPPIPPAAAFVLCSLISSALLHTAAPADVDGPPAQTRRLVRTVRIRQGAPISVRATVGNVTVAGWDRPDVEIEIVRAAPTGDAVSGISATIASDEAGLRIEAVQPWQQKDARLNGNVTLSFATVPVHARILALSRDGAIRSDIPLNLKTGSGPRFWEATLGGGGPVVKIPVVSIDVVSGNIRISRGTT